MDTLLAAVCLTIGSDCEKRNGRNRLATLPRSVTSSRHGSNAPSRSCSHGTRYPLSAVMNSMRKAVSLVVIAALLVAVTDVIKDCNIKSDQPIDIGSAVVYTAADFPGATTTDEPEATGLAEPEVPSFFASYRPQAQAAPDIPGFGTPTELLMGDFHVIPVCCGGLGITLQTDAKGVKMTATAAVELNHPSVHFALEIRGGTIYTAFVQLQGTAGFRVHFSAGTEVGIVGNIKRNFFVPIDASFPIIGAPLPLSVVLRQTLRIETIFTAQNGTLEATGEYTFGGDFKAGKENGGDWRADGPTSVTTKQNLANTLDG